MSQDSLFARAKAWIKSAVFGEAAVEQKHAAPQNAEPAAAPAVDVPLQSKWAKLIIGVSSRCYAAAAADVADSCSVLTGCRCDYLLGRAASSFARNVHQAAGRAAPSVNRQSPRTSLLHFCCVIAKRLSFSSRLRPRGLATLLPPHDTKHRPCLHVPASNAIELELASAMC